MQISDYLTPQRIAILAGTTKVEAIDELVDLLANSDLGVTREELRRAVWKREEMMSTGIGNGLAVPHVRLVGIKAAAMAVGISPAGIADYESLDKQPVRIIVLIAAPEGEHETYIRLLALTADVLKLPLSRQKIIAAKSTDEIYAVLTEARA